MPYYLNQDERFVNGIQYTAGFLDVKDGFIDTLTPSGKLSEGQIAYGELTEANSSLTSLYDVDIYDLGLLGAGQYTIDVDDFTWDFFQNDLGSVQSFSLLSSSGQILETKLGTLFDISFSVFTASNYYLQLNGPFIGDAQYSIIYRRVGDIVAENNPAAFSESTYTNPPVVGNSIGVFVSYADADGNSDNIVGVGWYLDGVFIDLLDSSQAFVVAPEYEGSILSYRFSLYDDLGNFEISDFYIIGEVTANVNANPTGAVIISGTASEGNQLTAITSTIADTDGLGSFNYQWLRDGNPITGAISRIYNLVNDDIGEPISVRITYTDGGGTTETLTSAQTTAVTNVNANPTGAVIISGTASEGNQLTAITSTIADTDGLGSFNYQWLRDGNPITGAISRIYNIVNDDIGEPISVRITYTDGGGTTETLTSAETAAVTSAIPPETKIPTDSADSIIGTELSEIIASRGGNDFITASKGNDRIDGGLGIDTVLYDGNQNSYTVTLTSSGVQVRDRRNDGNGTDTLTNTEFLVFDAGPYAEFNLTQFGGAASLNEEAFKGFIELYIAYYNRAPDAIGLNFWGTAYANGTSMEEMATLFAGQSETLRFYPENTSNAEFAEAVYNNVLGRTPDQAGFDFWVNSLNSGFVSRDQFILEVLGGVQDGSTDRVYLDNKVNVGAYFAVHKGLSDTSEAAIAMALYGTILNFVR